MPRMRPLRLAAAGPLILAGIVAGFCALEGVSSLLMFLGGVVTYRPPPFNEAMHTVYDPELGWVNRPSTFVPDLYGPGIFLHTNAQGFRGSRDYPKSAAKDRLRVICSGDSFTLGYGVDDDRAWCAELESIDPRLETVNMGQGGYGIDQTYLWYMRDGASLEHAVHVFAVITDDFARMQRPEFSGHAKPTLALEDGKLVARNVPVPPPTFSFVRRLAMRLRPSLASLRTVELVERIRKRLGTNRSDDIRTFDPDTWTVAEQVFETLHETNRAQGSSLLVVYLAAGEDYMSSTESDPWRAHLRDAAAKTGFAYLDLVPALRELPPDRMIPLFLSKRPAGRGHYSNAGNEWVAHRVHDAIVTLPGVGSHLGPATH
jgi:hypothetical protein